MYKRQGEERGDERGDGPGLQGEEEEEAGALGARTLPHKPARKTEQSLCTGAAYRTTYPPALLLQDIAHHGHRRQRCAAALEQPRRIRASAAASERAAGVVTTGATVALASFLARFFIEGKIKGNAAQVITPCPALRSRRSKRANKSTGRTINNI